LAERGIIPGQPGNWNLVVGALTQQVPASSLGIPLEADVRPGQLWLLVGDVMYPLIKDAGAPDVRLLSPAVEAGRAASLYELSTGRHHARMSQALGGGHRDGTWFTESVRVRVLGDSTVLGSLPGSAKSLETDLDVSVVAEHDCAPATPDVVTVDGDPCFLGAQSCRGVVARRSDERFRIGPFQFDVSIKVGECVELIGARR